MNRAATLDSIGHRRRPRSTLRSSSVQRSPVPNHRSASIFKLTECKHFHFFVVELGPVKVDFLGFKHISDEPSFETPIYNWILCLSIESNNKQWTIKRSLREMIEFDYQLHRCIFDRKYSRLHEIEELVESQQGAVSPSDLYVELSNYADRLSRLTGSVITCFPVLRFLELDSRGNHFIPAEYTPINTPAIAAAIVVRNYTAETPDQLTIRIGDIVSVIEMNSSEQTSNNFWKAKLTISYTSPSDSSYDDVFPHQFEKTAIDMTPPIESSYLSSGLRSLQVTPSLLSPVINNAENASTLTLKQSSDSDEPSPPRKERRVVFRSEMGRSFEAVNQIIDHLESEEKSDNEWATTEDEEVDDEERGSSPSLCLDMSRYDNVSPTGKD
ncbi:hypothetical protein QR680_001928 [Steinernema hermaphroditum]|uniref:SH3 domain-containing protein n=1 Tax=Steinernema hermaphroditum TaxID=289476 RepID=A0AA39LGL4_9BILA|nr:hypothetical protein QR680_001928 [Steinernema hermaphroditum]